jgi:uncharacterized membrane protein
MTPSIPGWDGIHPAMVQFSIVLLWVAPLLLLVSLFSRRVWRTWAGASLLVMALGSLAAWLAVASGHAAGQLVDKTPALGQAIARHEVLGVQTRNLFTLFTVVFALLMLLPAIIRRALPAALRITVYALFLVVYLGGTLWIANTASQGGRLVHELGVRAMVARAEQSASRDGGAERRVPTPPPTRGTPQP